MKKVKEAIVKPFVFDPKFIHPVSKEVSLGSSELMSKFFQSFQACQYSGSRSWSYDSKPFDQGYRPVLIFVKENLNLWQSLQSYYRNFAKKVKFFLAFAPNSSGVYFLIE